MWHYTIDGIPASKLRTVGKTARFWDEYAEARLKAERQLIEQIDEPHTGMLSVDFLFYLPHRSYSRNRDPKDNYADTRPSLIMLYQFADAMLWEYLLDKSAMIVASSAAKYYHEHPHTSIVIKPLIFKKKHEERKK